MVTEAQELEQLEHAHGEAPDSDFDDPIDTTMSEEFVDVEEEDSQPKKDTSQKASDTPKDEAKPDEKPEWDKERQRADQAEANYRKADEKVQATESKLEVQANQIESMQKRLDQFAKDHEVDLNEADPNMVDPTVLKALKSMQVKIDAATERADRLEQAKDELAKDLKNQAQNARQEQAKSDIVSDIEEEFPAKFRNEAIRKANQIVTDRGYAPVDRYEAAKILRGCYKELAAPKTAPKKATVPTDTGGGGTPVVSDDDKPTTLKERANFWRQKLRSK